MGKKKNKDNKIVEKLVGDAHDIQDLIVKLDSKYKNKFIPKSVLLTVKRIILNNKDVKDIETFVYQHNEDFFKFRDEFRETDEFRKFFNKRLRKGNRLKSLFRFFPLSANKFNAMVKQDKNSMSFVEDFSLLFVWYYYKNPEFNPDEIINRVNFNLYMHSEAISLQVNKYIKMLNENKYNRTFNKYDFVKGHDMIKVCSIIGKEDRIESLLQYYPLNPSKFNVFVRQNFDSENFVEDFSVLYITYYMVYNSTSNLLKVIQKIDINLKPISWLIAEEVNKMLYLLGDSKRFSRSSFFLDKPAKTGIFRVDWKYISFYDGSVIILSLPLHRRSFIVPKVGERCSKNHGVFLPLSY